MKFCVFKPDAPSGYDICAPIGHQVALTFVLASSNTEVTESLFPMPRQL